MKQLLVIFSLSCLFSSWASAQNQNPEYFVYVNFATAPGPDGFDGRLYTIEGQTITIFNLVKRKAIFDSTANDIYDSMAVNITVEDKELLINRIKNSQPLVSKRNKCLNDGGVRFLLNCGYKDKELNAAMINAYDDEVYFYVDFLNRYVPPAFKIKYNKEGLKGLYDDCNEMK
jgi:hypothetical protein